MRLRYFVIDRHGQLRKASQAGVQALWQGEPSAAALECAAGQELRLVSVLCDHDLLPRRLYLLRVPLAGGRFTAECRLTLHLFSRPDCVTPAEASGHHAEGWPATLFRQLAVALDVPLADLDLPLAIGGPLFTAAALHVSPRQALRYLP